MPITPTVNFKTKTKKNTKTKTKTKAKFLKDPTYAIFLKSWGFKDVEFDIPMCQSHSTRPQPIQLVLTMQKKLFMSSFQAKFLKIRFTKVTRHGSICANFFQTKKICV